MSLKVCTVSFELGSVTVTLPELGLPVQPDPTVLTYFQVCSGDPSLRLRVRVATIRLDIILEYGHMGVPVGGICPGGLPHANRVAYVYETVAPVGMVTLLTCP